ncbi:proline--tRNA ligase [Legionella sp. W05-934-2]|jgi:prolyl-tRNA synthetase|uniref:proline--tRNA ligase n=1 Tax=Legionella sp. W05-934-2 TaxID=1198649 RepID=UPI0034622BBA
MRTSEWFVPTLKETPNDAEIVSHQLMLRAGLIHKLGAGLYTWLPLGLRVLRKVENIVREEMDKAGALETLMPAVQPAELWQETKRWDTFGNQLLKMQDNSERLYCFGPTHEEVITDIMRHELRSYKQLPLNLYQIQTKFRDEIRPRFGVMRAREFIMKDAYSFNLDDASLEESYQSMYNAYCRIFERMGLTFRAVEADTGAIGGSKSHEFQVLADSGEDIIVYSDSSEYAANLEQATCVLPNPSSQGTNQALTKVETPNVRTIEQLCQHLACQPAETIKTLIVKGTESPWVALIIRGDDTLNEVKAMKLATVASPLQMATDADMKALNLPVGSLGPVGLSMPIIVDHFVAAMDEFISGANECGYHHIHACWQRDAKYHHIADLRNVKIGDKSPDGKGSLKTCRGIEVGHVFQLGDKYSNAMKAEVLDESGKLIPLKMGCYGLGISRVVAAAIEQHHDDKGIVWPQALAPYQVVIVPINGHRSDPVREACDNLYQRFMQQGVEVLLEDRKERPGVLFADHDLIGIPHRIVIGDRTLAEGKAEYKARVADESEMIDLDRIESFILEKLIEK